MMQDARLSYLFQRYADNVCTREELNELASLMEAREEEIGRLMDEWYVGIEHGETAAGIDWEAMYVQIVAARGASAPDRRRVVSLWKWVGGAAAACLLGFFAYNRLADRQEGGIAKVQSDDTIGNKAVLRLGNGQQIVLNEAGTDRQLAESNIGATNSAGGLKYNGGEPDVVSYNTLTAPRGVRYTVILPDGTKVMLNAESSLSYPTRFEGSDRVVKLTGEAYFKVSHEAGHPFVVEAGLSRVRVLGTTFNVNAYHERVQTTLEEGKVAIAIREDSVVLAPGQQGRYGYEGMVTKMKVDVDAYTGWTRDEVIFTENTTMAEAMEVLGRAYNYEIGFSDPELKNIRISANIDRSEHLLTILDYVQKITDIHFDVDVKKRRVTIRK